MLSASLLCAVSAVSNTASSLEEESLVSSSANDLDGGSSLRGLDDDSSLRGLDGGFSMRGLDGGSTLGVLDAAPAFTLISLVKA